MQRHLETKHPFIEKPIDFFRQKEKELHGQIHMIAQQAKITSNALEASYEVAYLIAQTKKPGTIGKTLIKPAAVAMCQVMHGEKIANELMTVPLSNDTVARRVHDIAKDIKSQLIDRINGKKMHCKSTNLLMCLILLRCWRSSNTHLTENFMRICSSAQQSRGLVQAVTFSPNWTPK